MSKQKRSQPPPNAQGEYIFTHAELEELVARTAYNAASAAIEPLAIENKRLRAENERLRPRGIDPDDYEAVRVGSSAAMGALRQQRNLYREAIDHICTYSAQRYEEAHKRATQMIEYLDHAIEESGAPAISEMLYSDIKHMQNAIAEEYDRATGREIQKLEGNFHPDTNPNLSLLNACYLWRHSGVLDFALTVASQSLGHANYPPLVCHEVLIECSRFGEPRMTTLRRLGDAWIAQNLGDGKEIKRSTLRGGLKKAEEFIKSGKTKRDFVASKQWTNDDIGYRTLQRDVRWYEVIKENGKLPDWLTTRMDVAAQENKD